MFGDDRVVDGSCLPISHVHPHGRRAGGDVELPVSEAVDIAHPHHHECDDGGDGQGADEPGCEACAKTVLVELHCGNCGPRRRLTGRHWGRIGVEDG